LKQGGSVSHAVLQKSQCASQGSDVRSG
jgi:hypothetical protein